MQSVLSFIVMLMLPGCLLLFARGVSKLRTVLAFRNMSKTTMGEIVDVVRNDDYIGNQVYLQIVEFQLKNRKFAFKPSSAVARNLRSKSAKLSASGIYPKNRKSRINTTDHLYGDVMEMIGAGVIFTLAALFLLGKLF